MSEKKIINENKLFVFMIQIDFIIMNRIVRKFLNHLNHECKQNMIKIIHRKTQK